ncbi:hypothetical protein D3C84_115720 [compost metagenome]
MLIQPALLAGAQLHPLGVAETAAGAPAAQDGRALLLWNRRQRSIDDAPQAEVVGTDGKAERVDLHPGELRQLHIAQVVVIDQVVGTDGVAQVSIRTTKGHSPHGAQGRAIQLKPDIGVSCLDGVRPHVVIQHRHPQVAQIR